MLYALIVILIAGVWLLLYGWWDTNRFNVRRTEIELDRLPPAFDGFTILQVSDLHDRAYGRNGRALIEAMEGLRFDAIAITGDGIIWIGICPKGGRTDIGLPGRRPGSGRPILPRGTTSGASATGKRSRRS